MISEVKFGVNCNTQEIETFYCFNFLSRSDANELTNASNRSAYDLTDTDELLTNFH